jgi:beta-lactamase class C
VYYAAFIRDQRLPDRLITTSASGNQLLTIQSIAVKLKQSFLISAALLLVAAPALAQEQQLQIVPETGVNDQDYQPRSLDSFAYWLDQQLAEQELPGVAVALVTKDSIIDTRTWGVRSTRDPKPITRDSLFRIASVSKTFAGTVASLLVDNDNQAWETPITDFLPQIQIGTGGSSRTITLRNLVSHTTGLMPHAYSNMLDDGVAYEMIQKKFHEIPTVCAPGRCYGYQNVVFSLIADVVEASTLRSYEQYLQEELFRPLGMATASTGLEQFENSSQATSPHRLVRGSWQTTTHNPAYYTVAPAAGINASVDDMAIWARANLGGFPEVLSESFLAQQHTPVVETPRGNYFNRWDGLNKAYYALGWRVFDYRGLRVIHHGGGVRGFRSEVALVPEYDLGLVVLFNAETKVANDVVPAFLDGLVQ